MRDFWVGSDCRVIEIPPKSPKANTFAESFIRSLKRECMDWFMCFELEHLQYLVRTWVEHYNSERPHRGIGMENEVLDPHPKIETIGELRCRQKLGGVIKEYYRDAV